MARAQRLTARSMLQLRGTRKCSITRDVPETTHDDPAQRRPLPDAQPSRLRAEALLGQRREIEIEHNGEVYRLRLTRAGKLILTK